MFRALYVFKGQWLVSPPILSSSLLTCKATNGAVVKILSECYKWFPVRTLIERAVIDLLLSLVSYVVKLTGTLFKQRVNIVHLILSTR